MKGCVGWGVWSYTGSWRKISLLRWSLSSDLKEVREWRANGQAGKRPSGVGSQAHSKKSKGGQCGWHWGRSTGGLVSPGLFPGWHGKHLEEFWAEGRLDLTGQKQQQNERAEYPSVQWMARVRPDSHHTKPLISFGCFIPTVWSEKAPSISPHLSWRWDFFVLCKLASSPGECQGWW